MYLRSCRFYSRKNLYSGAFQNSVQKICDSAQRVLRRKLHKNHPCANSLRLLGLSRHFTVISTLAFPVAIVGVTSLLSHTPNTFSSYISNEANLISLSRLVFKPFRSFTFIPHIWTSYLKMFTQTKLCLIIEVLIPNRSTDCKITVRNIPSCLYGTAAIMLCNVAN